MNTLQRRKAALVAGLAALALAAAACGSDSNSGSGATTTAGGATTTAGGGHHDRAAAPPTTVRRPEGLRHAPGQRLDLLAGLPAGGRADAFQKANAGTTDHLRRRRLGQGPHRPEEQGRRLRRLGLAVRRRRQAGRADPVLPDPARADHGVLQPVGRRQAAALAGHDREDLPAQDHELERSGDRRREPRRHAARPGHHGRPPLRRLGHDAELHRVPGGRGAERPGRSRAGSTIEWPADTQAGNGNQGVAQIVSGTAGAIGYVDSPMRWPPSSSSRR